MDTIDTIIENELELLSAEEEAREGDENANPITLPEDLYFRIQRAGDGLVSNSSSLIENTTSNLAECFMGIRCKFDGGKTFNRIQRGSFQHRSHGAGLRFQLGPDWACKAYRHVTGESPGKETKRFYETRATSHARNMKRKNQNEYKEKRKKARYYNTVYHSHINFFFSFNHRYANKEDKSKEAQRAYGSRAIQPQITGSALQQKCEDYKKDLTVSQKEAQRLEEETKDQNDDPAGLWATLRSCRLTASNFGVVCKRRPTSPVACLVKTIVYKSYSISSPSLRWGKENEASARKEYNRHMQQRNHPNLRTIRSGFVICPQQGWLGCSPDDWVVDPDYQDPNGIAEYKCPYSIRGITPHEACQKKSFFCKVEAGNFTLQRNHSYYYQVQGALGITGRKWCDFTVWTPKGIAIERIAFDPAFWDSMKTKLEAFFDNALLPELAAPEIPNGRPAREPNSNK